MANFQRTRSKVWWGDSPPNIGSPVAQPSNWNVRRQQMREENEWEPQLPHWVAQEPALDDSEPSPALPERHNSPGSHKSQDSGFSDSDSSPSILQQNANNKSDEDKKESEDVDKDKEVATPPKKDLNNVAMAYLQTPKSSASKYVNTPVRSVIKTPKDVQHYLEACCDIGHGSFESIHREVADGQMKVFKSSAAKNINNNVVFEKCNIKKNLMIKFETTSNEDDAESNIEYIQLSPSQQIAVNNQPRVRSPITRINYHTPVHFYSRNTSMDNAASSSFNRDRLNRSLDYKIQRLDEQLLDDGPHSLSYIDTTSNTVIESKEMFKRKLTDSLNLKTPKKTTSRTKKIQSKSLKTKQVKINKSFFNFLPKKNDSIKTIYDITSSIDSDRVPSLGLPGSAIEIGYNERCIDDSIIGKSSPKGILKTPGLEMRKITPPVQFQDPLTDEICSKKSNELTIDVIDFSESDLDACTSTPNQGKCNRMRPINLLENFNGSLQFEQTCPTTLECLSENQPSPVKHWLCEQIGSYEPECMTTLQSKALASELNIKVSSSSATITGNIRKVQTHGQIIVHQFKQVIQDLHANGMEINHQINEEVKALMANIIEFVLAHSITLKIKPPGETPERWDKIKFALQNNIQKVTEASEDISIELNETYPETNVLERLLKSVLDIFVETVRAVLVQQMKTLISMLEEPPSDMILKSTLTSLGHLGALIAPEGFMVKDPEVETIDFITGLPFIECGVPRALLCVIIESNKSSIKALSLRALATICVTCEALKQFEEAGGVEILSDILNEPTNPEPQMKEAITVLTQITTPWLHGDYRIEALIEYMNVFVKNITNLLMKTNCCQFLLLCCACLVNLVNMAKYKERRQLSSDSNETRQCDIIEVLIKHKTLENLLDAVKRRGPSASVFLQEQTATLMNVISTSTKGQTLLAACPATAVALVCFLRAPCASPARAAQLQAEFRLINQATEALARLCVLPEVTTRVIHLEGTMRLVRVIQAQKMQKSGVKCSDQILLNCLKALRLIAKNHPECLEDVDCDVTDMIKPKLMDSVKLYSAKQESYV